MNNNQPFFTQFMQSQELTAEQTDQVAGGDPVTRTPFPSFPPFPPENVTMKAPSDDDEGCNIPVLADLCAKGEH